MFVPGTTIEISRLGARRVYERVQIRYGLCGAVAFAVSIPVLLFLGIGTLILAIATLVVAIQALVIGSQALDDASYSACRPIAEWMLVFGSFIIIGLFCSCCCENRSREGESKALTVLAIVSRIFHLVTFCWICYGVSIVYNPGLYPLCTKSNYYSIFSVMVLFMFWGIMSMAIASVILVVSLNPIYAVSQPGQNDDDNHSGKSDEKGQLEEDEDEETQDLLRKQ
jgi:hypothetical protein